MDKVAKTSTVLQLEAVECGAASLAMVLEYHGKVVPLEELREACGVSRDGAKASNVVKAARRYGLEARGVRKEPEQLAELPLPMILHWEFNHFLVLEGFHKGYAYLDDPASGRRKVPFSELDGSFTGVALILEKGPGFRAGGERKSLLRSLHKRLGALGNAALFAALAGIGIAVLEFIAPVYVSTFVDKVLVGQLSSWFKPLVALMAGAMLLQMGLGALREAVLLKLETAISVRESSRFFWHVLRLPVPFFQQRFAGDLALRVSLNDNIAMLLSGKLATTVVNLAMVVVCLAIMFVYDIQLTLVGIGLASLNVAALRLSQKLREDGNQKLRRDSGKLAGSSISGIQAIETLKATGSEGEFFQKWAGYFTKVMNIKQQTAVLAAYVSTAPVVLQALNTSVILGIGGLRVMEGRLSVGTLVAFNMLMATFFRPINDMTTLAGEMQELKGDVNMLDDVLAAQVPDPPLQQDQSRLPPKLEGKLEIRGMTFGYNRMAPPLIEDFSLSLEPGRRVAFVGGSGSGKSTLAKLVAGLYEPWEGAVLFDGEERGKIDPRVITSSVAVVDQDISIFSGTILENLRMWDESMPTPRVVQAAKDALIHDVIAARTGGYHAQVIENGANFSGGQRQRMEIARALAIDPSILLMDEATSALDPMTEKAIDGSIRRRGCTCLIIAHRLSTIRDCDEIIVLDQGKVRERGTHQDLMALGGLYSELIRGAAG